MNEFNPNSMSDEDFVKFMHSAIDEFAGHVKIDPNYQFVRSGEKMGLGDWFEQFAMRKGLI